jgi:hypothetical protein
MDRNFRMNHSEQPGRDALITGAIRVLAVTDKVRGDFPKVGRGWGENDYSKKKGLSCYSLTP